MRIAVFITGEPRFCSEFNYIIENLKQYSVDWYFVLWSNCESKNGTGKGYINEFWLNCDYDKAYNKLLKNLPVNHSIKKLEIIDQKTIPYEEITHRLGWGAKSEYSHKMIYGWKIACSLKNETELENNFVYDLVIKGRPDAGIGPIDLSLIQEEIVKSENLLFFPGEGMPTGTNFANRSVTDVLFISSSNIMSSIGTFYDHARKYYDNGTEWNIEKLFVKHLEEFKIDSKRINSLYLYFRMCKDEAGNWKPNLWNPNFDCWN